MPNDELEITRLELHHHLNLLLCGGALHRAPLKGSPSRVLDLCTGTGVSDESKTHDPRPMSILTDPQDWAIDFGKCLN